MPTRAVGDEGLVGVPVVGVVGLPELPGFVGDDVPPPDEDDVDAGGAVLRRGAVQLATDFVMAPEQVQVHGPAPVTLDAVP